MSELFTLYTFIMCGLLCVTHRKAVFIKAVYVPSDRGSRLLGLDSTVVSVSPKAWAEPSCLLPQGSDGFGFGFGLVLMGCQLGSRGSGSGEEQGVIGSCFWSRWLVTEHTLLSSPACLRAPWMQLDDNSAGSELNQVAPSPQ